MISQPALQSLSHLPVVDGQERLATQLERDDVKRRIDASALLKEPGVLASQITVRPGIPREAGDQINRFLLCALVNESSRQIKASAEKAGEFLPMPMIVRGVLRSYRLAAMDKDGPLAGPDFDIGGLKSLNEKVLRSEIARYSGEKARDAKASLARADAATIKSEKGAVELSIELRARLATALR
jgi:hypothetical protein